MRGHENLQREILPVMSLGFKHCKPFNMEMCKVRPASAVNVTTYRLSSYTVQEYWCLNYQENFITCC